MIFSGTYQNQVYIVNFEQFLLVASVAQWIEHWTTNEMFRRREFEPRQRIFVFSSKLVKSPLLFFIKNNVEK